MALQVIYALALTFEKIYCLYHKCKKSQSPSTLAIGIDLRAKGSSHPRPLPPLDFTTFNTMTSRKLWVDALLLLVALCNMVSALVSSKLTTFSIAVLVSNLLAAVLTATSIATEITDLKRR